MHFQKTVSGITYLNLIAWERQFFNGLISGFDVKDNLFYFVLYLFFFALLFSGSPVYADKQKELIFAVHPFKPAIQLRSMFRPLLKDLESQLGYKIRFMTGKNYNQVIDLYKKGIADFGYLGPAGFVKTVDHTGVVPLLRIMADGKGTFQGVIVVKRKSNLHTLKELKGHSFAFGDPSSTLSHYVPHDMLLHENIKLADLSKYAFTGTHDNVARGVLLGAFDAGGLKPAVAEQYQEKGLRILARSQPIAEHLFIANKHLDKEMREKIRNALSRVDLATLKAIKKNITGLEPAKTADYHNLAEMISHVEKQDFQR